MKKYIKIISLIVIALIFIGTFVFLYQKSQPKDTVYDILHPQTTDLAQITVATGKIEPRDEVQIKPQISGIISEVYKEAGETVKKGHIRSLQGSRRNGEKRRNHRQSQGNPRIRFAQFCRKPRAPGRNQWPSG